MKQIKHAILRLPGINFSNGLTTSSLGKPDIHIALDQHARYRDALVKAGLSLRVEPEDLQYPDSNFVEDTAVLLPQAVILTRPGAESRRGEVDSIRPVLQEYFKDIFSIHPPGTLDGGDVCEADGHYFIGITKRTNEAGGRQLAEILNRFNYTSELIPINPGSGLLHLKSGISYLGDGNLAVVPALSSVMNFSNYHLIQLAPEESYAANCIRVNDYLLMAAGYPLFMAQLIDHGYQLIELDMSEYQKMDGGLSCLSLRF